MLVEVIDAFDAKLLHITIALEVEGVLVAVASAPFLLGPRLLMDGILVFYLQARNRWRRLHPRYVHLHMHK
jgi:hypothetical protein